MARRPNRPTLPGQGSLFGLDLEPELPVHESIADFAVHIDKTPPSAPPAATEAEIDRAALPERHEPLLFISFGSGSSGNCAYIGTRREGVLIDAGIDPEKVYEAMRRNGLSPDCIRGVCLTHDHSDHVRYVYKTVRKRPETGIYCTPRCLNGLLRRHNISRRVRDYHRPIYKEFPFTVAGLTITAFDVSHDGTDNCGFYIESRGHTFAVATDLGCITDRVDHYMRLARYIMIESNYDSTMLANGPYPQYLKARIAADNGHLDNEVSAAFVRSIYTPRLRHVFLCHLSQDNNTPDIAVSTQRRALLEAGAAGVGDCSGSLESRDMAVQLMALPRYDASQLMSLRLDD